MGLGRGLGALIPGSENLEGLAGVLESWEKPEQQSPKAAKVGPSGALEIDISCITPNRNQPRRNAKDADIDILADNIKQYGIIQPLLLREIGLNEYEIIAGERRFRAAMEAGLKTVPAVIREATRQERSELALVENLQRVDLNPIDEALGFQELIDKYNLTQKKVAEKIGKSKNYVNDSLRMMRLPQNILDLVASGELGKFHAQELLQGNTEEIQQQVAQEAIEKKLTKDQVRKRVKQLMNPEKASKELPVNENVKLYLNEIADGISRKLGTKVSIMPGEKKSKIEIEYYTKEDLERILEILA